MEQSFKLIKCPNFQTATLACLTHSCHSSSPFQCGHHLCKCHNLHSRCKIMKIQALQDYLINWERWIGKLSKQFMDRVMKIFANAKSKLNREEQIFKDYCKDLFLGKDYTHAMHLLEKRQFNQLSSSLLSSSIKKITEIIEPISFEQFTTSQMKKIDQKIKSLIDAIDQTYMGKQRKIINIEKFGRCNSAILQKSKCTFPNKQTSTQQTLKISKISQNNFHEILKLKTDLTYPKLINSKIVKDSTSLNQLIGKKIKRYHLTYRATQSSFSITQFYRKHNVTHQQLAQNIIKNNQKREIITMIIVKTEFGKVIGGFTTLKWQKTLGKKDILDSQEQQLNPQKSKTGKTSSNKLHPDYCATTNLFSLDFMERYDLLKPEQAIYCGKTSIGFGKNDLRIVQRGNTTRKNYCKFPNCFNLNMEPYLNISKSGMILSGSKYSPFFKVDEWQAFLVQV